MAQELFETIGFGNERPTGGWMGEDRRDYNFVELSILIRRPVDEAR